LNSAAGRFESGPGPNPSVGTSSVDDEVELCWWSANSDRCNIGDRLVRCRDTACASTLAQPRLLCGFNQSSSASLIALQKSNEVLLLNTLGERDSRQSGVCGWNSVNRCNKGSEHERHPLLEILATGRLIAVQHSGPGTPAAPAGDRLRLLPSGPDLVHKPTPRGTRTIDAPNSGATGAKPLGREFSPARADCGYRAPLPPRLKSGALLHDLFRHVTRHRIVVMELHRERCASLRHRPQMRDISEHLLQRHMRPHDHGRPGTLLVLDLPTAAVKIAHHIPDMILRRGHLNIHDRFQNNRAGQLHAFPETSLGSDFERQCR